MKNIKLKIETASKTGSRHWRSFPAVAAILPAFWLIQPAPVAAQTGASQSIDLGLIKSDSLEPAQNSFTTAHNNLLAARTNAAREVGEAKKALQPDPGNEMKRAALADAMTSGLQAEARATASVSEAAAELVKEYLKLEEQINEAGRSAVALARVKGIKKEETERQLQEFANKVSGLQDAYEVILSNGKLSPEAERKIKQILLESKHLKQIRDLAENFEKRHSEAASMFENRAGEIKDAGQALEAVAHEARDQAIILTEISQDFGEVITNVELLERLKKMKVPQLADIQIPSMTFNPADFVNPEPIGSGGRPTDNPSSTLSPQDLEDFKTLFPSEVARKTKPQPDK